MPLVNGEPFQPLSDDTTMSEAAWKSTIFGILESYNSSYDSVMEMAQNGMDAIDILLRDETITEGRLHITIDFEDNTIQMIDNGVGMELEMLSSFFRPNVSFKVTNRTSRQALRGYKGVGATYLSYGFAGIHVSTKTATGEVISYHLHGGRRWVNDEEGHEIMPQATAYQENDPVFTELEHGTLVRIKLDRDSNPTSPGNLGGFHRSNSAQRWEEILQTRTAIGQIVPWRDTESNIKFKLILKEGQRILQSTDWKSAIYDFKHEKNPPYTHDYLDFEQFILEQGGGETVHPRYRNKTGMFLTYSTEELAEKLPEHEQYINRNGAWCYALLGYTKDMFGAHTEGKIPKGYAIVTQGMIIGSYHPIQLTRYTGLGDRMLVLVHFDNVSSDTGRKTVMEPAPEIAHDIAKLAHKSFTTSKRFRTYLRPSAGSERGRGGALRGVPSPFQMKNSSLQHLEDNPLPRDDIFSKCEPSQEQDVVSLFAQLCTANILRGYSSIRTFEGNWTYDGIFLYTHRDVEEFTYSAGNQLGLLTHNLNLHPLGQDPGVVEYKLSLDDVVDDFSDEESPKHANEVELLVAWEAGESFDMGSYDNFLLRECCSSNGNLNDRQFFGQTHTLVSQGTNIPVILLKYTIGLLSRDYETYLQLLSDNFNPQ